MFLCSYSSGQRSGTSLSVKTFVHRLSCAADNRMVMKCDGEPSMWRRFWLQKANRRLNYPTENLNTDWPTQFRAPQQMRHRHVGVENEGGGRLGG